MQPKSSSLPPLLARMASHVQGEGGMNWAFHIWEDPGFIFVANPICACSTLKLTLNYAAARASGIEDFAIDSAHLIHNREANVLKTPREVGYDRFLEMLEDPAIPLFTFVRSPESRFLSAFRKKLMRKTPFAERVRAYLGVGPEVPLSDFLTLDKFAQAVRQDIRLRDLDEHWRLQRKQIFFDELPRMTFGRVETFAEDCQKILGGIFGADGYRVMDAVVLNPANASANRKQVMPDLSEAARADVAEAYRQDHLMLQDIQARATK
ncbi:sulfotransferase family 2 domain-containing protein [Stagnihabitans tardus]|uniref:Sulfotransferase family 2 domain-containing protein n=1 Tax=Stagnihabitans tardus TaxID=2699202 RepID=A0AAE4Y8M3_9RHOB|nr:sulfotransferase family 2 domain-containing protein [Stagnihabitans tardus]NBZ88006.1 sulfotransferase family 2 domain-containing protein [Stagnihabitans tardus]